MTRFFIYDILKTANGITRNTQNAHFLWLQRLQKTAFRFIELWERVKKETVMTDRKNALKIWEEHYGKSVEATDFTGRKINKSAYDQRNSKFGWAVTLVLPRSAGGKETDENLICVHMDTAFEKADEFPFFVANDKKYEILCDDDNEWVIDEAHDSESIAEQEARTAAAMEKWDEIFGADYGKAKDFCGRIIHKDEYNTESEFAWRIAPYVDSKPTEGKNAYIANILSVEEALGKTAFKANGRSYALNKDNGAYYFKAVEVKPPKKVYDIKNPYDLKNDIDAIISACSGDNEMLDFLVIRAVSLPSCTASMAEGVSKTVAKILGEACGTPLASEISEMCDEQGSRYMFMTYRFTATGPADFERVFLAAQLVNTYAPLLTSTFGLSELKLYNHALFVNRAHVSFPVGLLSGYYPEFKALMDSIYGSAYGFYEGEPQTTLFVSNFIVFNVAFLSEMHPQGQTVYFTDLYMVEHNLVIPEVSERLQKMLMGVPENEENEETVAPVTEETPIIEELPEETEAPAEELEKELEKELDEEIDEEIVDEIVDEAPKEENADEESVNEPCIAPVTDEMFEAEGIPNADDGIPEGEQMTLDIDDEPQEDSNGDDDGDEDEGDDDGVFTLDLDSLD